MSPDSCQQDFDDPEQVEKNELPPTRKQRRKAERAALKIKRRDAWKNRFKAEGSE